MAEAAHRQQEGIVGVFSRAATTYDRWAGRPDQMGRGLSLLDLM
jgi:hypothetical protein